MVTRTVTVPEVVSRLSRECILANVFGTEPISDPKQLDTGGPYSLVFQESTGKYVHRHELEESKH